MWKMKALGFGIMPRQIYLIWKPIWTHIQNKFMQSFEKSNPELLNSNEKNYLHPLSLIYLLQMINKYWITSGVPLKAVLVHMWNDFHKRLLLLNADTFPNSNKLFRICVQLCNNNTLCNQYSSLFCIMRIVNCDFDL